jgi:hypothetical protein
MAKRLFVLAALESRIFSSFLEDVPKRDVEISQRSLQYYAAHFVQKGLFRSILPLLKRSGCLGVAQGLLRFFPGLRARLKSRIPDRTRTAEGVGKSRFPGISRKEPVFIGFLNNHVGEILSRFALCGAAKFISTQVVSPLCVERSFAFQVMVVLLPLRLPRISCLSSRNSIETNQGDERDGNSVREAISPNLRLARSSYPSIWNTGETVLSCPLKFVSVSICVSRLHSAANYRALRMRMAVSPQKTPSAPKPAIPTHCASAMKRGAAGKSRAEAASFGRQ